MKITNIIFHQTFPTGNFSNNKLGVEIELGENEDPINGFEQAKKIVNAAFERLNQQIEWADNPVQRTIVPYTIIDESKQETHTESNQAFIELINSKHLTKKSLLNFKPQVEERNNEAITKAFNERLKQFEL